MTSSLQELESVVNQVYGNPNISNKAELEQYLNKVKSEATVQHVQYYLSNSANQYLLWFALTVSEHLIQNRWTLSNDEKEFFRKFLLDYLIANKKNIPQFISTKLMKVCVLIAKVDWPTNYPSFIPTIQQLIINPQTTEIGVEILKISSEEFISDPSTSTQRRAELRYYLQQEVPKFLDYLYSVMSNLFNSNTTKVGDSGLLKSNFDKPTKKLVKLILDTYLQFFSWTTMNENIIKPDYITLLFNISKLVKTSNGVYSNTKLSILSISCINELLSKAYVPALFKDYISLLFTNIKSLILAVSPIITTISPDYLQKSTQLLELFIGNQITRIESISELPVIELLGIIYSYTFQQREVENFLSALQIWSLLLDYLVTLKEQGNSGYERYMGGVVALANDLVKKLMYSNNGNVLNGLSAEIELSPTEEQNVSDLEDYISTVIEVIAKVGELFSAKIFEILNPTFMTQLEKFSSIVNQSNSNNSVDVTIKDLSVIIRLITRLEEHFVNEFTGYVNFGLFIIQRVLDLSLYISQSQVYAREKYWEELLIMCIQSLSGFVSWFVLYEIKSKNDEKSNKEWAGILSKILDLVLLLLSNKASDIVCISCCRLMRSLICTVKPQCLPTLPSMNAFYHNASSITDGLPIKIQGPVFIVLSSSLLCVPSTVNSTKELWDSIQSKYSQFFTPFVSKFVSIPQTPNFIEANIYAQPDVLFQIQKYVEIFKGIIESVNTESKYVKNIVFTTFRPVLPIIIPLFNLYASHPQILSPILELLISLFGSLKIQVGTDFIQQTVSSFLPLLSPEKLSLILDSKGSNAIVKLLQIFTILFEDSSSTFDLFLAPVYSLVMEQILPHARDLDIKMALYKLFYTMLLQKQKFLISSQFQEPIIRTFVNSLREPDINLVKQNLSLLNSLNEKQRLFSIFVNSSFFVTTLFTVIFNKMHNILRDEIMVTIYFAAAANFDYFYSTILGELVREFSLPVKTSLLQIFNGEKDQLAFLEKLNQFVNDFMYYHQK